MIRRLVLVMWIGGSLIAAPQPTARPLNTVGRDLPPGFWQLTAVVARGMLVERVSSDAFRLDASDAPWALQQLVDDGAFDLADKLLRQAASAEPPALLAAARALAQSSRMLVRDQSRDGRAPARRFVDAARARLAGLPREAAADLEAELLDIEVGLAWPTLEPLQKQRQEFKRQYAGTAAVARADLRALMSTQPIPERLVVLERFAEEHPNSTLGAAALYQVGFDRAHNAFSLGVGRAGTDPTDRFFQVLAIVRRLEREFPASETVERAQELIFEFNAYEPRYSPENLDRLVKGYAEFVKDELARPHSEARLEQLLHMVDGRVSELFALKGDAEGPERLRDEFMRSPADADTFRYLRALALLSESREPERAGDARARGRATARGYLERVISPAGHPRRPSAMASLAELELSVGTTSDAIAANRAYLAAYPAGEWAWLAWLRIGQAHEAAGDLSGARDAYRASTRFSIVPAVVLGHEMSARSHESQGRWQAALDAHAAALTAWRVGAGEYLDLPAPVFASSEERGRVRSVRLDRSDLAARVDEMRRSLRQPNGEAVERARWEARRGDSAAAVAAWQRAVQLAAGSSAKADAQDMLNRARVRRALAAGDVESASPDRAAALAELKLVAAQPDDFGAVAARLARGAIDATSGDLDNARTATGDALRRWRELDRSRPIGPRSPIEQDVDSIVAVVFRPAGGGAYSGLHWNAFDWPASPPFLLSSSEVSVTIAGGSTSLMRVPLRATGVENLIGVDRDQLALLEEIIAKVGGTQTGPPRSIMETNRPVGASTEIVALWTEFFPARRGHWAGWVLRAYPIIHRIDFLDAARTKAAVAVEVGYSGGTVMLEKIDGVWKAVKFVNQWVT